MKRGYFGIGIVSGKSMKNIGTLWRSAHCFGASFIYTAGARHLRQPSDTTVAWRHVPMFHYDEPSGVMANLPHECKLVVVELVADATPLAAFTHPERAVYVLGAEDHGVPQELVDEADHAIVLPGRFCVNVAVAGSVVMAHRIMQRPEDAPQLEREA